MSERWRQFMRGLGRSLRPLGGDSWLALIITLAVGATQLTLLAKPSVGVYINAGAFVLFIGLALLRDRFRPLAVSAAVLPVANMLALSLPQTTVFAQTAVFYSIILLLGFIYRFSFTLDYPLQNTSLSLRRYAIAIPLMIVIGEILGGAGYGMLRHHYTFDHTSLPLVATAAVVFAVAEEALFRGLIQQTAMRIMHPLIAALLSTILFTLINIDNTTLLAPLFAAILGGVLAATYYVKQSVVLTIALNAAVKLTYIGLMASFIFR